jgi:hypothetical protein
MAEEQQVQFDGESQDTLTVITRKGSFLERFFISRNIAKDPGQAQQMMLLIAVGTILVSGVIFAVGLRPSAPDIDEAKFKNIYVPGSTK